MDKKVISTKSLPTKLPVPTTVLAILALDYWSAPMWLCGGIGTLFILIWISQLISFSKEKQCEVKDIFKD